jgi:hypothetical protein
VAELESHLDISLAALRGFAHQQRDDEREVKQLMLRVMRHGLESEAVSAVRSADVSKVLSYVVSSITHENSQDEQAHRLRAVLQRDLEFTDRLGLTAVRTQAQPYSLVRPGSSTRGAVVRQSLEERAETLRQREQTIVSLLKHRKKTLKRRAENLVADPLYPGGDVYVDGAGAGADGEGRSRGGSGGPDRGKGKKVKKPRAAGIVLDAAEKKELEDTYGDIGVLLADSDSDDDDEDVIDLDTARPELKFGKIQKSGSAADVSAPAPATALTLHQLSQQALMRFSSFWKRDAASSAPSQAQADISTAASAVGLVLNWTERLYAVTRASSALGIGRLLRWYSIKALGHLHADLAVSASTYPLEGFVTLTGTVPGRAAARAGLKKDDVLWTVNGVRVRNKDELFAMVGAKKPGSVVTVTVIEGAPAAMAEIAKEYVDDVEAVEAAAAAAAQTQAQQSRGSSSYVTQTVATDTVSQQVFLCRRAQARALHDLVNRQRLVSYKVTLDADGLSRRGFDKLTALSNSIVYFRDVLKYQVR